MAKCEHHDDYIRLHESLEKHVDRVEKDLNGDIQRMGESVDTAFDKIDELRDKMEAQGRDHKETEVYVKNLYDRFEDLTVQMQSLMVKLDGFIGTMATVQKDTDNNTAFSLKGRQLVYEILKWIVLLVLGYALNNQT